MGRFSKIVGESAKTVVAIDSDHFAVERLYRELKNRGKAHILPLLQNVADPSPSWGWRNEERVQIQARVRPDFVLCLALLHHVVITANIPLREFIQWLAGFGDQLIIEYVAHADDKVKALLLNKEDKYSDYSRLGLEQALGKHSEIVRKLDLESGNRHLYWCRASASTG
jgi:hypothetical protein